MAFKKRTNMTNVQKTLCDLVIHRVLKIAKYRPNFEAIITLKIIQELTVCILSVMKLNSNQN